MRYAQLVLPDDLQVTAPQQFVILEQASGYGILNSDNSQQRGVVLHPPEEQIKCDTWEYLDRLSRKIAFGCHLMETSRFTLYCDLLHLSAIKKSRPSKERDSYDIINFSTQPRFLSTKIEKVKKVLCKIRQTHLLWFCYYKCTNNFLFCKLLFHIRPNSSAMRMRQTHLYQPHKSTVFVWSPPTSRTPKAE
jgi:hypothetical protein